MYIIKGNRLKIEKQNINSHNIVVVVYLKRIPKMLEAILFLYINKITFITIDPKEPMERTKYKIYDLKKGGRDIYILTSKSFEKNFEENHLIIIENINNIKELGCYFRYSKLESRNDIAYILYTSGSSGNPKGVEITYKGLNNFIESMSNIFDFFVGKKIACLTTISFDIFFLESIAALTKNLTVVLLDENEQKNPRLISEIIIKNDINIVQMTPSGLQMLINYDQNAQCLNKVEQILIGGEMFPLHLLKILQQNTNAKIYNMYGPTETTIWATVSELTNKDTIDIGQPIDNIRVYILDETLNFVPKGVTGEICIAGDGLAKGYFNNIKLTNEKFIYKNERMYRTGDYGRYLQNGNIEYIGRIDNQIKIRGHRIEIEEIEKVLIQYDTIMQAVIGYESYKGEKLLVAFYISNTAVSSEILRQYLFSVLPEYMIPSQFIQVEQFFYTITGKLDRKKIWNEYIDEINKKKSLYEMNNLIEFLIAEILEKKSPYKLDENMSLTEIGIDSIDFMSIIVRLESELQIEFELDKLLLTAFGTIKTLINYIKKRIEEKNSL